MSSAGESVSPLFDATDHRHMARALRLARRGLYTTDPNPRVGCVVAAGETVVGEGWHERAGEPHAEVHALAAAGAAARGATVYVTLEPCSHHGRTPPCADALVAAGVGRVVIAMTDPNPQVAGGGAERLRAAGVRVDTDLMADAARELNPGFASRMERGRPWVRCKLAASLDGRTAMASGESQWITGASARSDVHRLRARSSAVVTGIGTVLADDPSLNVRLPDVTAPPPLRVVLDPVLSMRASAGMLDLPGRTIVFTAADDADADAAASALMARGAEVITVDGHHGGLDLPAVLEYLAAFEVNEVLLETGATLSGAMLAAGLVDELVVYLAPHLMGAGARGMFELPGLECMAERIDIDIRDVRQVGRDWRFIARVASGGQ